VNFAIIWIKQKAPPTVAAIDGAGFVIIKKQQSKIDALGGQ
jgi:hypothetical protein